MNAAKEAAANNIFLRLYDQLVQHSAMHLTKEQITYSLQREKNDKGNAMKALMLDLFTDEQHHLLWFSSYIIFRSTYDGRTLFSHSLDWNMVFAITTHSKSDVQLMFSRINVISLLAHCLATKPIFAVPYRPALAARVKKTMKFDSFRFCFWCVFVLSLSSLCLRALEVRWLWRAFTWVIEFGIIWSSVYMATYPHSTMPEIQILQRVLLLLYRIICLIRQFHRILLYKLTRYAIIVIYVQTDVVTNTVALHTSTFCRIQGQQ